MISLRRLIAAIALLTATSLWWSAFGQLEEGRTIMLKGSGAPSANCTVGERYFRTDSTAGQNLYLCTATNTWTQASGGGSSAPVIRLPIGTCNTGPTYIGGVWAYSTTVAPNCSVIFSGFTAHNISRMIFDGQNDETVAPFTWPSGAGTSVTFRGKWSYSLTTTPTVDGSIACAADGDSMTAAPASPAEITPVALTFNTSWATANRLNEGTVTLSNAGFTAGKACWIQLVRTDAGGGNLLMHNTPQLEF